MYKKLCQYYIFKTTSSRLKNAKYDINFTLKEARENGEIVSMGESQLIRSLLKIKNKSIKQEETDMLFLERKKIRKKTPSYENYQRLIYLEGEIDDRLFLPDIVSVVIEHNSHYRHMIEQGFFINNKKYVRLICGAGQSRRNTVIFINSEYELEIKKILNNDRDLLKEISPAKFNAYFALASSATYQVSEPYFCVIPDCEITREEEVEYVEEKDEGDIVYTKKMELPFNLFDGQGIISPRLAKQWAIELGLDYIPASFIIRNAFLKGMVCVIDFHSFSEEIGKHIIKDIWGNDVNVRDMDLILTSSQFKLWDSYSSCSDYISKCRKNELNFGVSRYSPKEDTKYVFSNYQFLQVLNLTDSQIESLCKKTIEYFEKTLGGDIAYTLMYLMGKISNKKYDPEVFDKISDNITKALLLNNDLINDPYIRQHILRSLNKKIKESYMGSLLLDGNYQMIIADPYAFMEHMFGLPVNGLLSRGTHYSNYWNVLNKNVVVGCRAPLTWRSEVNRLNLIKNESTEKWYSYLNSGIVYNVHGVDYMLQADCDMDGDLIMTTDCQEFIDGSYGGLPITYEKNKVPKEVIDDSTLYEADIKSFNTRIGFITNCSTTLYSMLEDNVYSEEEKQEIVNRLKICRKEQGNQIDKAKGLYVKPFPKNWTKKTLLTGDETEEERNKIELFNKLVISKRPYFMRWLYGDYNRDYRKYREAKEVFCRRVLKQGLDEFLIKNPLFLDEKEMNFLNVYLKNNPLLDAKCLMNKISHYMEKSVSIIKEKQKTKVSEEIIDILKNKNMQVDNLPEKIKQMNFLYEEYKKFKQSLIILAKSGEQEKLQTLDQYNKVMRQKAYLISTNIAELANVALAVCYVGNKDRSFVWNLFGEGLIENILSNNVKEIKVPFLDKNGTIKNLGSSYSLFNVEIKRGFDNDYIL